MNSNLKWRSLYILLLAQLLIIMDIFIINVAIPAIQKGIHANNAEVQLLIAAYLIGYAIFLVTGGRTGDRYGRKVVFISSLLGFMLSSCLCGIAQSALQLNMARLLQGVSASFLTPQILAYMQLLFPGQKERTRAFGLYGITIGLATMAGQFLGGYLSSVYFLFAGWRWIFFINIPIGIVALYAAAGLLQETPYNRKERFDYTGILLLAPGLACLIYPLTAGRELSWPLWSIMLLGLGIVFLFLFIADQKKKSRSGMQPLMDMTLFRYHNFNTGLLSVSLFFMMLDAYFMMLTIFLQDGLGISALQSGLAVVFQGAGFIVSSLLSARYVLRYGKKALQTGVLIIIISIALQILLFRQVVIPFKLVCLLLGLHGLGVGLVLPSMLNAALQGLPAHLAGAASGVYTTFQQTATALGICIVGGLFFQVLHSGNSGLVNYRSAFLYGNTANIILLLLVFGLMQKTDLKMPSSKNKVLDKHPIKPTVREEHL
jgi:EmrB/QacA subfamily drug resistance transporter